MAKRKTKEQPADVGETIDRSESQDALEAQATAEQGALDEAKALGHRMRPFESMKDGNGPYRQARCGGCMSLVLVSIERYPAPHFGGSAIKIQCTATEDVTAADSTTPDVEETTDMTTTKSKSSKKSSAKSAPATTKTAPVGKTKADTTKRPAKEKATKPAAAETKKTADKPKTKKTTGETVVRARYKVFEKYSVIGCLRAMGAAGVDFDGAMKALAALKLSPAEHTVRLSIKQTNAKHFKQAELTTAELAQLKKLAK